MDDGAAREIERTDRRADEPAFGPDHVAQRLIDERHPEEHQDHERREAHAPCHGAADDGRRDHDEHHLEHGVQLRRYRRRIVRIGLEPHPLEQPEIAAAEEAVHRRSESGRIAEQYPLHRGDSEQDEAHHEDVQHVFGAADAAVVVAESRRHDEDHGRRDDHPARISGVYALRRRRQRDRRQQEQGQCT